MLVAVSCHALSHNSAHTVQQFAASVLQSVWGGRGGKGRGEEEEDGEEGTTRRGLEEEDSGMTQRKRRGREEEEKRKRRGKER